MTREELDFQGIQRNWPQYEIMQALGQGAYGKVYKVRKPHLDSYIYSAIKVIHIPPDENMESKLRSEGLTQSGVQEYYDGLVQTFLRESQVMEQLKGAANIMNIEDSVVEKYTDRPGYTIYIKMELLESFEHVMQSYHFGSDDIVSVALDLCEALIVCEQKHIVHRDIKPANVFINEFGTFKLGDFGVARQTEHTRTNMTQIGTGMYMAPELYQSKNADNRVDIYSLGIMLYRLANDGCFPFTDPTTTNPEARQNALVRRLAGEKLPLPKGVDPELGQIILKACAHNPKKRYASAKDLKRDLELWKYQKEFPEATTQELSQTKRMTGKKSVYNVKKKKSKKPFIAIAGVLVLAIVGVAAKVLLFDGGGNGLFKDAEVGDVIQFGSYEQDNNTSNGKEPIDWEVLKQKGGKLLVMSKYALDTKAYNDISGDTTWENCSLREWLNGDFYEDSFSSEDKEIIVTTKVSADENPDYDTDAGNDTQDKVFLLSIDEVNDYVNAKATEPTKYAEAQGAFVKNGMCWWWLRTPGSSNAYAAGIGTRGGIGADGSLVESDDAAVRPVMWIKQ